VVLAGGCDSRLDPLMLVAYQAMSAVSRSTRPASEVSRPFDGERDGFVLGEGAAVLMLESLQRAKRRGATIYAEVTGYGSSFDAYGLTRPEPEGKGAALSMKSALKEARLDPADVDYINAHGTSTRLNDIMETTAVKRVFGHRAPKIPMSSQKSMVRAPDRCLRCAGGRRHGDLPAARGDPADDQSVGARPGLRPRLRAEHRPRAAAADGALEQLRLRRAERQPGHGPHALRREGFAGRRGGDRRGRGGVAAGCRRDGRAEPIERSRPARWGRAD
jgi:hypothetical protein